MQKTALVIGSGFAGMSAASHLAKLGWKVSLIEKHSSPGGRARRISEEGFTFDLGPSWYWMPDVFERYYNIFGKKTSELYNMERLDPSYRVYWQQGHTDLDADLSALKDNFESIEKGAGEKLEQFLKEAEYKYETGINNLVYKPGQSILEFLDKDVIKGVVKLDVFSNMQKHVAKYFKDERLKYIMEFPVLFLGALAKKTPALYSLMNYADIVGGTWYPEKGMYSVVEAMHAIAEEQGVQFHFNKDVQQINVNNNKVSTVVCKDGSEYTADVVISGADYHFTEQLLAPQFRNYKEDYWASRKMAPSSLLYYIGLNKKLKEGLHHNLFFDTDFNEHADEIYLHETWPKNPLFYASIASKTDNNIAPENCENIFLLIPVAAGLSDDNENRRQFYLNNLIKRLEDRLGEPIQEHIIYQKSFAYTEFVTEYNSYKGNAYGLANTLMQTAILKPSLKNKHLSNLFYTGQLTVPGPGVPPSLISGEVVAKYINSNWCK
jgi:phytoene desaturase